MARPISISPLTTSIDLRYSLLFAYSLLLISLYYEVLQPILKIYEAEPVAELLLEEAADSEVIDLYELWYVKG
jgi:hypothetical protein